MTLLPLALFSLLASATSAQQDDPDTMPIAESFRFSNPFGENGSAPAGYHAICEATATFHATQHVLRELQEPLPLGLGPWFNAINFFFGGMPFPGMWEGYDPQDDRREMMKMEYRDLPSRVKEWLVYQRQEDTDGRWLLGVFHKPKEGDDTAEPARTLPEPGDEKGEEDLVVLFAAGAVYEILPIWVAETSDCEQALLDLERYAGEPTDGGIVGWVVEREGPDWASNTSRDMTFKVKAQVLEEVQLLDDAEAESEKTEKTAEKQEL